MIWEPTQYSLGLCQYSSCLVYFIWFMVVRPLEYFLQFPASLGLGLLIHLLSEKFTKVQFNKEKRLIPVTKPRCLYQSCVDGKNALTGDPNF